MKAKPLYVGIRVRDLDESIEFYTKLLGLKFTGKSDIKVTKGKVAGLTSEDGTFTLELNYYEADSPYYSEYVVGEGLDHLAFQVENIDNALEEAAKLGYRTKAEVKAESGRWAYIEDPNGIWIELVS